VSGEYDPIAFARGQEQIRQEAEAFNQQKSQDAKWFVLRLVICSISVALLCIVMAVCCYIFYFNKAFPEFVVKAASAAFFGDIIGLLILVWKVVVGSGPSKPLTPVTKAIAVVD
jgi:hypothetical protein